MFKKLLILNCLLCSPIIVEPEKTDYLKNMITFCQKISDTVIDEKTYEEFLITDIITDKSIKFTDFNERDKCVFMFWKLNDFDMKLKILNNAFLSKFEESKLSGDVELIKNTSSCINDLQQIRKNVAIKTEAYLDKMLEILKDDISEEEKQYLINYIHKRHDEESLIERK